MTSLSSLPEAHVHVFILSLVIGGALILYFFLGRQHGSNQVSKSNNTTGKPETTVRLLVDEAERYQEQVSSFTDTALRQPSSQIRLLKVLHDHLTDPFDLSVDRNAAGHKDVGIWCSLTTWNLNNAPPYIVVSYTWGEKMRQAVIRVDGRTLYLRPNCYYALWQASVQFPGAFFWIDSICINQDDHEEKSHQVRLMGKIYAGATGVAACVGRHT